MRQSMNFNKNYLALLALISFHVFSSTQDEIKHLLQFVETTGCKYERNGTMHNGAEAVKHINKKYQYYADDINSTEDFIKYSATKSKMSGKYYKIHCANQATLTSQDWLLGELKTFRKAQQ
tara:strand:- start:395 stop:757 length:363 start_codon:yes stop_codon:yes gene_type:complete